MDKIYINLPNGKKFQLIYTGKTGDERETVEDILKKCKDPLWVVFDVADCNCKGIGLFGDELKKCYFTIEKS